MHGRGAHGSMPQASVDPVVLAAMIVLRLQTVVSREVAPAEPAVAHRRQHPGRQQEQRDPATDAVLELNMRTYSEPTRSAMLDAIRRIVTAECQASRSPADAGLRALRPVPAHRQRRGRHDRVAAAFADHFGEPRQPLPRQSASEDFSDIPTALGVPYTYWGIGGIDPETYRAAEQAGRVDQDIPVNHSARFAPVLQPTLDTGTQALVAAALAWL